MLNKVLSFAVLSSLLFSFASCKDDDDKDDSNNQEIINVDYTVSGTVGDYSYVDLGLKSGTLWATYNVGASKVTEYGYTVRWGEIAESNGAEYKWSNDSCQTFTKYVIDSKYGTVDSLSTLEPADDIATVTWGSDWRMPTATELQELIDGCDWEWIDDSDGLTSGGRLGISKTNGNKIFLPTGGQVETYASDNSHAPSYYTIDFRCADYWSSSLDENNSNTAFQYKFYPESYTFWFQDTCNTRDTYGCVRAVCSTK